jgi:hypothetical protein
MLQAKKTDAERRFFYTWKKRQITFSLRRVLPVPQGLQALQVLHQRQALQVLQALARQQGLEQAQAQVVPLFCRKRTKPGQGGWRREFAWSCLSVLLFRVSNR